MFCVIVSGFACLYAKFVVCGILRNFLYILGNSIEIEILMVYKDLLSAKRLPNYFYFVERFLMKIIEFMG